MVARKEQRVADVVEGLAEHGEPRRSRLEEGGQSVLSSEPMVGGKGEAAPAHRLVVVQVGAAFTPAAKRDVVREHAAQPQRVVAKVGAHEEAALRVGALDGAS